MPQGPCDNRYLKSTRKTTPTDYTRDPFTWTLLCRALFAIPTNGRQRLRRTTTTVRISNCLKKNQTTPRPSEHYLIHTFSVLSLQLKKLRGHNEAAIDLSNANPARGQKVNGSHHGDIPLLKPIGMQIATKPLPQVNPPDNIENLSASRRYLLSTNYKFSCLEDCQYLRI